MILPLGDSPNPRGTPLVTYAVLAANVAVYVLITLPLSVTSVDPRDPVLLEYLRALGGDEALSLSAREVLSRVSAYDLFIFRYGFRPAAPNFVALFTSLFLHAGLLHLLGNMLFLWIYGDNVEHQLGHVRYFLAYIATGVVAVLCHSLFDSGTNLPLIGASGAISGILGFYFVWFPRNRVRLLILLFPFIMDTVRVPARLVLGLFLVIDNLLPFLTTMGTERGGVAYGAHIGGFLAGLAVAWFLDRREVWGTPKEYDRPRPGSAEVSAAGVIEQALAEKRFGAAAEMYFSLPPQATRRLLRASDSLILADWLRQAGHPHAALAVYRRHIRDFPRGPGLSEAHLGVGLVQLEDFGQPTPAYQHFLDALDTDPAPATAARARRALAVIDAHEKFAVRGRPRRGWN